jgi:hypothetical protein
LQAQGSTRALPVWQGIDVLWNPDSRSDYSLCSSIYVDEKVPAIDVWTDLRKRVAPSKRRLMKSNHRVFIEAKNKLGRAGRKP